MLVSRAQLSSITADEIAGNIETPRSFQRSSNHVASLQTGVAVHYVDVEFTLLLKSRPGEITASEKADFGVYGVGPEKEVKLSVERVAKEKFHYDFPCADLVGKAAKPFLVLVGWRSEGQLIAKFLRSFSF